MNFFTKKMITAKLDKEGRKFIAPHFRVGVITPKDLHKIADVCERFPESKIKLSSEIIIGGISDESRIEEFRRILGIPTFSVAGFCVRPVKICAGGFICRNNLQDSFSLGIKLDERFSGRKLPFKMIISVSGCPRSCSEPRVRDIGIVASRQGYSMFVAGAAGAKPRIGTNLTDNLSERDILDIIERIISLYEKRGATCERLGLFIERFGFEEFENSVLRKK